MKEENTRKTEALGNAVCEEILEKFGFCASFCFFACFYRLKFDLRTADWALFAARDSQKHSTQSYVFQICSTLQEPSFTVRDLR